MKNIVAPLEGTTKRAKIYRDAARLIEIKAMHSEKYLPTQVRYTCCAVAEAAGIFPSWNHDSRSEWPIVDDYVAVFAKSAGELQSKFDGIFDEPANDDSEGCRILALCFMAAMVEAGDA